jgi:hypothetical protein
MCTKQPQPEGREIKGTLNIYRIVEELWQRAAPGLSEKELEWFADDDDGHAEMFMGHIAEIAEKVGCHLLEGEGQEMHSEKHDVCDLLFFLSESIRCAKALMMVRNNAADLIRYSNPM